VLTTYCLTGDEDDDGFASDVGRFVHRMLRSFALYPFKEKLHWLPEHFEQVVQASQRELRTRSAEISFEM
jgi:hypothetical protein